jgi:mannan endo-1,4-beta-mannosidase
MNFNKRYFFLTMVLLSIFLLPSFGQGQQIDPVTPNASPEARALLKYIQSLSGKHILTGQHNYPATGDTNTLFAAKYIGETPVVWSQDFGFSRDGDKDSYLSRPEIIKEAIRQYKKGAIVDLCWHAVPPTADEPVTFQPLPGADPLHLASVQGKLTDQQFKDLLTPGTELHKHWEKQIDVIASYLKQLQDAKVPVLWRPYHEMNGNWFWWGGRYEGKYTTAALYRQIFDRMVNYHKLNNLIWIWSVDRPTQQGREFSNYYPGDKYLDILALDVYGNDFSQSYYDGLMALSKGKPVTLAEVGNPPSLQILDNQPNWVFWVVWADMVRNTPYSEYQKFIADPRVLFMEDQAYIDGTKQYRIACGLEPLTINRAVDFTGEWKLNECESNIPDPGQTEAPYKMVIVQKDNKLNIKSFSIVEWSRNDAVTDQAIILDGTDNKSTVFNNVPRIQNANWNPQKDTLTIDSKVTFNYGGNTREMKAQDVWTLQRLGRRLVIFKSSEGNSAGEKRTATLVYNKQ